MNKKNSNSNNNRADVPGQQDANAGSGGFNQGVDQEPNFNDGTKVSDEEKRTGRAPSRGKKKDQSKERGIDTDIPAGEK